MAQHFKDALAHFQECLTLSSIQLDDQMFSLVYNTIQSL